MSALPHGWIATTLGDAADARSERVSPSTRPDARFIGLEHVESHTTRLLGSVSARTVKSAASTFTAGDVLYGRLRPYLNKVAKPDFDGLASAEFIVFRQQRHLRNSYLKHRLSASDFVSFATRLNAGDRPRVDFEMIGRFPFLLPPPREQERIASKLEELLSALDASVASLERVEANLECYRAAVLKAAVEGRLTQQWRAEHTAVEPAERLLKRILQERRKRWEEGQLAKYAEIGAAPPTRWKDRYKEPAQPNVLALPELPIGWCWATVDQLSTKVADGVHKKPNYLPSGVPFVTVRNLTAGPGITLERARFISPEDHAEFSKRTTVEKGDLLVSKDGTLGVIRLVDLDVPFSIFVSVALVKPVFREMSQYMCWAMQSSVVQSQMVPKGSGLQHIHLEDLRQDCIPLPPAEEQAQVVAELDRSSSVVEVVADDLRATANHGALLRQAILKRAFEGRLVPQDPRDEPASELLARIRAGRTQPDSGKRRKSRPPV